MCYISVYNVNERFSFIINYVSEHQLSHVVDASHTMPTMRANRGPKLLKLIEETLSDLSFLVLNQAVPLGTQ